MPSEQVSIVEQTLANPTPIEQEFPADEIDSQLIEERFNTLPDEEVTLLATNLARPDGFVKTLIMGSLITSEELITNVGADFVRTHRGYYMKWPSNLNVANSYLSLKVGCAERSYGEDLTNFKRTQGPWKNGFGFAFIAKEILNLSNTKVNFGNFQLYSHKLDLLEEGMPLPPELAAMTQKEFREANEIPSKANFIKYTHMARRYKKLYNGDQGELNINETEHNHLPTLDIKTGIIFIPHTLKPVILRYIRLKISEISPYADQILDAYGIDIKSLTPEAVLNQYPNIYWYPQQNIDLAIKYLSTHPERIAEIIDQGSEKPVI